MNQPTPHVRAAVVSAREVLDALQERFINDLGAPSQVVKGTADNFATQVDLDFEKIISSELQKRTNIAVHGEEFGGPPVDHGLVWVVDPIDGTYNYAARLPLSGILLGLLHDGQPVAGLIWLPALGQRFEGVVGDGLYLNGHPVPRLQALELRSTMVAFGAFNADSGGTYPGIKRIAALTELSRATSRIRMFGATGIDLAYTAAGLVGGAVCFGHHPWDNAPGAALVLANGGVISDLRGNTWHSGSDSIVAAAPEAHDELLTILRETL